MRSTRFLPALKVYYNLLLALIAFNCIGIIASKTLVDKNTLKHNFNASTRQSVTWHPLRHSRQRRQKQRYLRQTAFGITNPPAMTQSFDSKMQQSLGNAEWRILHSDSIASLRFSLPHTLSPQESTTSQTESMSTPDVKSRIYQLFGNWHSTFTRPSIPEFYLYLADDDSSHHNQRIPVNPVAMGTVGRLETFVFSAESLMKQLANLQIPCCAAEFRLMAQFAQQPGAFKNKRTVSSQPFQLRWSARYRSWRMEFDNDARR